MEFWKAASYHPLVKQELATESFVLSLYNSLKSNDPVTSKTLVNPKTDYTDLLIQDLVDLIVNLTAGNETLEEVMAQEVLKDLMLLRKIQDMRFVNLIFMRLIKSETTVPVSLIPFDSELNKWHSGYLPTYKDEATLKISKKTTCQLLNSKILVNEKD